MRSPSRRSALRQLSRRRRRALGSGPFAWLRGTGAAPPVPVLAKTGLGREKKRSTFGPSPTPRGLTCAVPQLSKTPASMDRAECDLEATFARSVTREFQASAHGTASASRSWAVLSRSGPTRPATTRQAPLWMDPAGIDGRGGAGPGYQNLLVVPGAVHIPVATITSRSQRTLRPACPLGVGNLLPRLRIEVFLTREHLQRYLMTPIEMNDFWTASARSSPGSFRPGQLMLPAPSTGAILVKRINTSTSRSHQEGHHHSLESFRPRSTAPPNGRGLTRRCRAVPRLPYLEYVHPYLHYPRGCLRRPTRWTGCWGASSGRRRRQRVFPSLACCRGTFFPSVSLSARPITPAGLRPIGRAPGPQDCRGEPMDPHQPKRRKQKKQINSESRSQKRGGVSEFTQLALYMAASLAGMVTAMLVARRPFFESSCGAWAAAARKGCPGGPSASSRARGLRALTPTHEGSMPAGRGDHRQYKVRRVRFGPPASARSEASARPCGRQRYWHAQLDYHASNESCDGHRASRKMGAKGRVLTAPGLSRYAQSRNRGARRGAGTAAPLAMK